ncbi:hypothetical protein [Streptomyces sp. NPDC048462]|uniref:hypothetical protein n=1 Tax=Streptomyces sp. NPDC048462 TaxID=3365555 RepID=UPI0037213372
MTEAPRGRGAEGVRLVTDLVERVPGFRDPYEAHVFNEDTVLPHVFFWDVTRETVRSYLGAEADVDGDRDADGDGAVGAPDWRRTLGFLEEQFTRGIAGIDEVVVTSFLGYLPFPGSPGHGLTKELGPALAAGFARIRPAG